MSNYVGITDNRMKHILEVARKCYWLAKYKYDLTEEEARKAFVIGFNHDIGYEFSNNNKEHPDVGYKMLKDSFSIECIEIREHGKVKAEQGLFQKIINEADLTVDGAGIDVTVQERLHDIENRYSEESPEYMTALELAKKLKLI